MTNGDGQNLMCIVSSVGLERMTRTAIVYSSVEIQTELFPTSSTKGYRQIKLLHCCTTELQIYIRIRLILQHKSALPIAETATSVRGRTGLQAGEPFIMVTEDSINSVKKRTV
jgi:hypothetical protein